MAGWKGGQGFTHTGSETSCNTCHSGDRPANTTGFLNLNANAPFDYNTHAASLDCASCHKVTAVQRTTADWATGHYTHSPTPTSCQGCHSSQRPATYGNNATHPATGDCAGCHQASLATSFAKLNDWAGGVGMSHAASGSTNTTAAKGLDCYSCHGQTGTASKKLAVLASAHYQQATTCVGCHTDFSSFNSLKFNHATNATTCQNCHSFKSGTYTSFTNISKFNTSNSFTLSNSVNVSASKSDDGQVLSFTKPHSDSHLTNCSACHSYTAPTAGANVWQWKHEPNGGRKSDNGCNLCHQ
jgi:predicted CXXCH cytochrome family protein